MRKMEKTKYKKLLENALRFHKTNNDKVNIKRVNSLLENLTWKQ